MDVRLHSRLLIEFKHVATVSAPPLTNFDTPITTHIEGRYHICIYRNQRAVERKQEKNMLLMINRRVIAGLTEQYSVISTCRHLLQSWPQREQLRNTSRIDIFAKTGGYSFYNWAQ